MNTNKLFACAVVASLLLHVLVLVGIGIRPPDPSKIKDAASSIDVVLVNSATVRRPDDAVVVAQHNLDGGGNTDEDRRAKSPLPVVSNDTQTSKFAAQAQRLQQLEQEAKKLLTQIKSPDKVAADTTQPRPTTDTAPAPTASDILNRSMEIARLEGQISKDMDSYQKRPRRRFVGARTQEYRFARYIEDWRQKIERVGTFNYPQAAREQKIYGSLQLTVSLKADGTIDNIEINRSSGQKILDAAAIRIVNLAAPYAPFPPDIVKDTDILSITRTWTFTSADQVFTE